MSEATERPYDLPADWVVVEHNGEGWDISAAFGPFADRRDAQDFGRAHCRFYTVLPLGKGRERTET